jgi:hypothetical protein
MQKSLRLLIVRVIVATAVSLIDAIDLLTRYRKED